MADKQEIRANNSRLGGISQDPFLGSSNQYEHSYNISYRDNIKGISLAPKTTLFYTTSGDIVKLYTDSRDNIRSFNIDGEIHKNGVYVATNNPDGSVFQFNAIEFRPNQIALVYYNSVYEIDTISNAIVFKFNFPATININPYRPVAVAGDTFYFGAENTLYYTTSLIMGSPQVQYTAGANEIITYISQYLDQLKIYTFLGLNSGDTTQYMIHKGIVNQYQYKQKFNQVRPYQMATDGPNDYFIEISFEDTAKVGVFSGPSYQYLYRDDKQKGRLGFSKSIACKGGMIYVGGTSNSITDGDNRHGVFIIGKYLPQYPMSTNFMYVDGNEDDVNGIEFGINGVYIAKGNQVFTAKNEGFLENPSGTPLHVLEGELVSRKFYGESMAYAKKLESIWFAGYVPANTSVDIYMSMNGGSRQLAQTVTSSTIQGVRKKIFMNDISLVTPSFDGYFDYCQYKIVLKGNGFYSPEVYELNMFYSLIQN